MDGRQPRTVATRATRGLGPRVTTGADVLLCHRLRGEAPPGLASPWIPLKDLIVTSQSPARRGHQRRYTIFFLTEVSSSANGFDAC